MKKLFLTLLTAATLAFAAGCSSDGDVSDADLQAAAGRIATLEEQVRSMSEAIASLKQASEAADKELLKQLQEQKAACEKADAELWEAYRMIPNAPEPNDFTALQNRLDALEATVRGAEGTEGLVEAIGKVRTELAKKLETADVEKLLLELETKLQPQIAALDARIASCEGLINTLATNITALQSQLDAMSSLAGGKVDQAVYDEFTRLTNEKIQKNAETLAALTALCAGFEGGTTIKSYIDAARADVVGMLGDYVKKETYEAFYAEYTAFAKAYDSFKTETESELAALRKLLEALETGDPDTSLAEILQLTSKIEELDKKSHALEDVYAQFNKQNSQFLNGVNDIINETLADGGAISTALASQAAALQAAYEAAIGDLDARLKELEERVGDLEDKVADLIDRIQSLVYVPKTSDGMIHIGTTYIAQQDENGEDIGPHIEVTPTKKLEYRVSPAKLRDELLKLPLDAFSFYQEHVSRAEGDGMDEFHILAIEEGNGDGEILITVDNDHDFTRQNLAVALCIKSESASGVTTEFTSSYTTVVGDGRNIWDRFYLAKKTATGYEPVRDDHAVSLIRYDDTNSLVSLLGNYELVYDNGESCMSLTEAEERFEWQVELTESRTAVSSAFKNGIGSAVTISPSNPNMDRKQPVTVSLNKSDVASIGKAVTDTYQIVISDGTTKVTLIPEFRVSVIVCSDKYWSSAASIRWNYTNWHSVTTTGSGVYTTSSVQICDSRTSSNSDLSYLPDKVVNELFVATDAGWTVQQAEAVKGDVTACVKGVVKNANHRAWNFAIDGYVYSEGSSTLTLNGSVKPSSLVSGTIDLAATVTIDAPPARKAVEVNAEMTSKQTANDTACQLYYLSGNTAVDTSKEPYTSAEINTYFGNNVGNVTEFFGGATLNQTAWTSSDNKSLPASLMILLVGTSRIGIKMLVVDPQKISPALTSETTFTVPEGCAITVPNGPTIPVTGAVKVTIAQ